ncbi:hypothetical protein [Peribacillus acanthi]|uniref:hypothetical protein n=1 Tax=Peribacillus acanthi TaxID=2171554 RepID=UPI000D3E315B|nr:hypothetical protein [Peribacillus acanthi]
MDYYGTRRKRNIDLSRYRQENTSPSIEWEKEEELEEGYEYEETDEGDGEDFTTYEESNNSWESDSDHPEQLFLNGKLFKIKQQPKKQSFNDTHVRITTYLEQNVHQILRMLQKQGQIESITKFVNESIKSYLMEQYQEKNN